MNKYTFCRFLYLFSFYFSVGSKELVSCGDGVSLEDSIQSPIVLGICTRNFLSHTGQETGGIEETSEPIGSWPWSGSIFAREPRNKLMVAISHRSKPSTKWRIEPWNLSSRRIVHERFGHLEVVDNFNALSKLRRHDDLTINGCYAVSEPTFHDLYNCLETLDFLEEEHN